MAALSGRARRLPARRIGAPRASGGVSANGARRSLAGPGAALDSRLHGRLPGSCRGLLAALVLEPLMPPVPVLASLRLPLTLVAHIRQPALGEVLPIRTLFA
jgi:hypothetical protein